MGENKQSNTELPITVNLTGREKQVLILLKKGLLYKEIALELNISIKTVEYHVSKLLRKFEVGDRFDLTSLIQLTTKHN